MKTYKSVFESRILKIKMRDNCLCWSGNVQRRTKNASFGKRDKSLEEKFKMTLRVGICKCIIDWIERRRVYVDGSLELIS